MPRTGRPLKFFDWKLLESHAKNQSNETFAAETMLIAQGIDPDKTSIAAQVKLIQRRLKKKWNMNYVQFVEQKKEYVKSSLRSWQIEAARNGNVTMQIWLGKQYLGQKDKHEISGDQYNPIKTENKIIVEFVDSEEDKKENE